VGLYVNKLRVESIHVVDKVTYDLWVMDTTKHTIIRLWKLQCKGIDVLRVREHYSTKIIECHIEMITNVIKTLNITENYKINIYEQLQLLLRINNKNSVEVIESKVEKEPSET